MLHKNYFIPDSTQCLFFKLLSCKTHYLLALGPSTVTHKFPFLLAPRQPPDSPPQASLSAWLSRSFVLAQKVPVCIL